jgi:hypothetical protein
LAVTLYDGSNIEALLVKIISVIVDAPDLETIILKYLKIELISLIFLYT